MKSTKQIAKQLSTVYKGLGIQRDKLRNLISEAEEILEDTEQAQQNISEAVVLLESSADEISKYI